MTSGSSTFESITFVSPLPVQGSNPSQRKGKTGILSPSSLFNSHRRFLCLYSPGLQSAWKGSDITQGPLENLGTYRNCAPIVPIVRVFLVHSRNLGWLLASPSVPAYVVFATPHPPVTGTLFVACPRRYSRTSRHPTSHDARGPTTVPPFAKALGCQ